MTLPAGWEGYQNNFLGLEEPWCHPDQAGVYVLPAPYDHTSSYVPGSDQGPSAIIEASHQVECYDEMLRCEPFRDWGGIATVTPLDLRGKVDREAVEAIEAFVHPHVGAGRFIVTLTGEHTGALGAIRAHAKRYPNLNVVQIDAHGDLRHAYQDNPYSHASVMARVVDDGLPVVQVGIRSICPEEIERITSSDRSSTFFAAQLLDPSWPDEGKSARFIPDVVKPTRGPVYLTHVCARLHASCFLGLGGRKPRGLGMYVAVDLLTALADGVRILGMDLSEIVQIEGLVAAQFGIRGV